MGLGVSKLGIIHLEREKRERKYKKKIRIKKNFPIDNNRMHKTKYPLK